MLQNLGIVVCRKKTNHIINSFDSTINKRILTYFVNPI